jgi:hypothetical protein
MFYIIQNGKITDSSESYLESSNWITIEKDFTDEELEKIQAWYSYNMETWEFQETPESIEYKKQILQSKKTSLLKEMWELKQIKDWVLLVWEDTTEIDKKIQELKKEYNNL